MTKEEVDVLKAIAKGRRDFGSAVDAQAILSLAARGHISAEIRETDRKSRQRYVFAHNVTFHSHSKTYFRVSAPKIEQIIATVGLNAFMQSLETASASAL